MKHCIIISCILLLACTSYGQDTAAAKPKWYQKLIATPEERENSRKAAETLLPVDPSTHKVTYADIVEAAGLSKKDLYGKAMKWIAAKNSPNNPYTISYESADEGSVIVKGTFTLPADRKKYPVQFTLKVSTKAGKFKYEFSDMIVQYFVAASSSAGGFGYWSSASHKDAEMLEYTLETFYPSRVHGRKPVIKNFEEIDTDSFEAINKEMVSLANSLKQSMSKKEDW